MFPVNAVEFPASLGMLAEGSSFRICSRNGLRGPLAVPVQNSSTLNLDPGFCRFIRLLEFSDLNWLDASYLSLNLRLLSGTLSFARRA
jgi:hypothetical protein